MWDYRGRPFQIQHQESTDRRDSSLVKTSSFLLLASVTLCSRCPASDCHLSWMELLPCHHGWEQLALINGELSSKAVSRDMWWVPSLGRGGWCWLSLLPGCARNNRGWGCWALCFKENPHHSACFFLPYYFFIAFTVLTLSCVLICWFPFFPPLETKGYGWFIHCWSTAIWKGVWHRGIAQ